MPDPSTLSMLAPDEYPRDNPESRSTMRGTITIESREYNMLYGIYLELYRVDVMETTPAGAKAEIISGVDSLTRYYEGKDGKVRQ